MFNLLTKSKEVVRELTTTKTPVTAKEIHDDFYTEASKLLLPISEDLLEKSKRAQALRKTGFIQASGYKDCEEAETAIHSNIQASNISNKYPSYKLITEEQVKSICKKYGLFFSSVMSYTGEIPDKNIQSILEFKLDESDYKSIYNGWEGYYYNFSDFTECYGEDLLNKIISAGESPVKIATTQSSAGNNYDVTASIRKMSRDHLFIVAPLSMFNLKDKEIISDYIIVDKDPVVLFKVNAGYIIVTAWGHEANIPEIVNEKMN